MCKINYILKNRYELNERIKENDQHFHKNYPMEAMKLDYAFRYQDEKPEVLDNIIKKALDNTHSMLQTYFE